MKALALLIPIALLCVSCKSTDVPAEPVDGGRSWGQAIRGKLAGAVGFRITGGEASIFFKYGEIFGSDQEYLESRSSK